jgi:hypothetical protein
MSASPTFKAQITESSQQILYTHGGIGSMVQIEGKI